MDLLHDWLAILLGEWILQRWGLFLWNFSHFLPMKRSNDNSGMKGSGVLGFCMGS